MKRIGVVMSVVLAVAVSGCSSSDSSEDVATSTSTTSTQASSTTTSTSAQPVAITSWQTWGQNFRGQIKTCAPLTADSCFTDNRLTVSDMQRAITDNNLDLTATQGGITNPLQSYATIYDAFVSNSCVGTPQSFSPEAVTCQVKRDQLRTYATQISSSVDTIAAG